MKRILLILFVLAFSIWLGLQLNQDPGYILISFKRWTMEMTLWVGLILFGLLFLLLHYLFLLFRSVKRSSAKWHRWKIRRKQLKARAKTEQGLIEFSEGYWLKAKEHLVKALPNADNPLLNYLTAARAAQEMNDSKLRDQFLREAGQAMPEAKIAVELTQAQLQLANHQWEQALATLRHLQDLAPSHPYVLKLLMQLYKDVRDWPQLIKLLPELRKNKVITEDEFHILEQQAYLESVKDLSNHNQPEALHQLFNSLPHHLSKNEEIISEYSQFLINEKDDIHAEKLLRKQLRRRFSESLIELYGKVKASPSQLIFAESLIKKNPHSAGLYLCLGHLSMDNHLWGKARDYLEKSIQIHAKAETYEELGHLLENFNEPNKALNAYKEALKLIDNKPA